MLNVVRSELVRLRRPRLLIGWFGLMALFALMINQVMFGMSGDPSAPANGPGVAFPSAAELAGPSGPVAGLGAAASLFGIVTLSFWAIAVSTDYSSGLIRLLVSAQPHRWKLLAGKVIALTLVTAVATTVAMVFAVVSALPAASSAGVSTDQWGTDMASVLLSAWVNAFAAMLVWGVVGLVLAVVTRSSAIAISIGAGYVLVRQSLGDGADWLLGSTLNALAAGGNQALSYGTAAAMGAVYIAVGLLITTVVVTRRDVSD
jgi:ABC-type transport system involved in multi-copper enzyme maturation permease subunit